MSESSPYSFLRVDLAGLKVSAEPETTRGAIVSAFDEQLDIFNTIYDKRKDQLTPAELETDAAAMQAAIEELIRTARDGIELPIDRMDPNTDSISYHYTQEMLTRLDNLFETLKIAGATIDASSGNPVVEINGEAVRRWLDFSFISPVVGEVLQTATSSTENATRTLQSMIELDYVRTGNEILSEQMTRLEEALGVTQNVLSTLGDVQDLHNQVKINEIDSFNFDYYPSSLRSGDKRDISKFMSSYTSAAESYFGDPIPPLMEMSGPYGSFNDLQIKATELYNQLKSDLSQLIPVAGSQADLVKRLTTVIEDLSAGLVDHHAFYTWLVDNYSLGTQSPNTGQVTEESGQIQQNISFAISAGQAFNDSQKEEVRRFMFVFEEYYKSASSLLSKISQIIEKIAQGISR